MEIFGIGFYKNLNQRDRNNGHKVMKILLKLSEYLGYLQKN